MIHNVLTIVDNFIVLVSRIINITFLFLGVFNDEEMTKLCDFEGNIEEQLQNIPVTSTKTGITYHCTSLLYDPQCPHNS
jgi:hypothetical protein